MKDIRDHSSEQGWVVGQAGRRVRIADAWRVLDVGSGHHPHPRANTLLERFPDDDAERGGAAVTADPRLVIGDAQSMPFDDGAFDYVIASHVAEHVEDPAAFCGELTRVARAGYIETPGWLGDILLREPFHRWRVRRTQTKLRFDRVTEDRQFGHLADVVYAVVYIGIARPGHRTWIPRRLVTRLIARAVRYLAGRILLLPGIRPLFYMEFEWHEAIAVAVVDPQARAGIEIRIDS